MWSLVNIAPADTLYCSSSPKKSSTNGISLMLTSTVEAEPVQEKAKPDTEYADGSTSGFNHQGPRSDHGSGIRDHLLVWYLNS